VGLIELKSAPCVVMTQGVFLFLYRKFCWISYTTKMLREDMTGCIRMRNRGSTEEMTRKVVKMVDIVIWG